MSNEVNHGIAIVGRENIDRVRTLLLAQGLEGYAQFKMIPTRGATPTFMLQEATKITGTKYKRGAYLQAARDLRALLP